MFTSGIAIVSVLHGCPRQRRTIGSFSATSGLLVTLFALFCGHSDVPRRWCWINFRPVFVINGSHSFRQLVLPSAQLKRNQNSWNILGGFLSGGLLSGHPLPPAFIAVFIHQRNWFLNFKLELFINFSFEIKKL